MKKILWIFSSALLLSVAVLSTGCGEDETGGDKLAPVVTLTDGPNPDVVVEGAETEVVVTITANQGTDALKAVTVYNGSDKVAIDDLTVDGVAAAANPILIVSPSASMTWDIGIIVRAAAGTATYRVEVEDEGGLVDQVEFDVTVETPVSTTIEGAQIRLWNQAGPAGRGAINLDNGESTGAASGNFLEAELRDMGIDSSASSVSVNWRRRVAGINGTEVRFAGNIADDAELASVASVEAITALYDGGTDLIPASSIVGEDFEDWGEFRVSEKVEEGDVFIVYKSSTETYYYVLVESIVITTDNNEDYYNVTIKF